MSKLCSANVISESDIVFLRVQDLKSKVWVLNSRMDSQVLAHYCMNTLSDIPLTESSSSCLEVGILPHGYNLPQTLLHAGQQP